MDKVQFFCELDKIPTGTAQQRGVSIVNGHVHHYVKKNVQDAHDIYRAIFNLHRPSKPFKGAVALRVSFYYPIDKAKKHKDGEPKTSRPDTDNLVKLVKDVLTEVGYWGDDAQVAKELVTKSYSRVSGIYVSIEPLNVEVTYD